MSITDDHSATFVETQIGAPQNFHPEFGYLCPSPRLLRKGRRIILTVAAGMVIAAGAALGLSAALMSHAPGAAAARSVVAASQPIGSDADHLATGRLSGDQGGGLTLEPSIPGIPVTDRSAATDRPAPTRMQASCDDPAMSFLMSRCQLGYSGRSHMTRISRAAHAASRQVATMPAGRIEAAPEQDRAVAAPAAVATDVAQDVAQAELPAKKAAVPAKKPIRTAHRQAPNRNAGAQILAAAPAPGFGFFGSFQPQRSGYGAWAMSVRAP